MRRLSAWRCALAKPCHHTNTLPLREFSNNLPCCFSISEGYEDLIENNVVEYLVPGGFQSFGETFSVPASSFN